MADKEFNLSEKMDDKLSKCEHCGNEYCTYEETYFKQRDVKEFIKRLKEEMKPFVRWEIHEEICAKIDILAGDKLNGK